MPAHPRIEDAHSAGAAVVVHKDDEGVLFEPPLGEFREQSAEVVVDVRDHAEELRRSLALVARLVLGAHLQRTVRRVRGEVQVEGLPAFYALDPLRRLREKDIGAVAFGLLELAVVFDERGEIRVARRVAARAGVVLADAAAAVDEDLVEAASLRLILVLVAEVPFAKHACGVTDGLQHLRQRDGVERHALAFQDGVGHAVLEFVPAGEQRTARGRAGGADVEVREPHAFAVQPVEVRRLEHRIAMRRDVAVALIVGEDENDVRAFARKAGGVGAGGGEDRGQAEERA